MTLDDTARDTDANGVSKKISLTTVESVSCQPVLGREIFGYVLVQRPLVSAVGVYVYVGVGRRLMCGSRLPNSC